MRVTWDAPQVPGDFAINHYQVTSLPQGATCLTVSSLRTCDVVGLIPGRAYAFAVQALSGAGWGPSSKPSNSVFVPGRAPRGIVIAGKREGDRVVITGQTTGFAASDRLRVWLQRPGDSGFRPGLKAIRVNPSGAFTWQRIATSGLRVYVSTEGNGSVRSNTVTVRAAR